MGSANLTLTRIQDLLDGPGILGVGQDGQALVWDFASGTFTTVEMSVDLSGLLPLTGGTMTGPIVLAGDATEDLHPITKQALDAFGVDVDLAIASLQDQIDNFDLSGYLELAGGTMTGALVLAGDPTENLHPATKQYVDGQVVADHGGLAGLGDDDHSIYALADGSRGDFLPLAGGAMTGNITLPNLGLLSWGGNVQIKGVSGGNTLEIGNQFGHRIFISPGLSSRIVSLPSSLISQNQNVVMLAVRGASGQTNSLQEWLDSAETTLASVNSEGRVFARGWQHATKPGFSFTGASQTGMGQHGGSAYSLGLYGAGTLMLQVQGGPAYDVKISGGNLARDNIIVEQNGANDADIWLGTAGDSIGFFGATPAVKPTVTGSRGGNAALASLLTHLASLGLIADSSS